MRVPLVDLARQHESIAHLVMPEVQKVIASQRFILGAKVAEFEAWLADFCGAKHAVGVASGSDALFLGLVALGIGAGDLVITTPLTFVATAEAIARAAATPIFADVDRSTLNLDPSCVRRLIESHADRAKIKAILPVHLFGRAADMGSLHAIAHDHSLHVIEDAAQAIGASCMFYDEPRSVGAIGAAGALSFFPSKNLGAWGDGGAVITNVDKVAWAVRSLRTHGISSHAKNEASERVGMNSRLDAIQAAVLHAKGPHLREWTASRVRAAERYRELLSKHAPRLALPEAVQGHVYNQFVIAVTPELRDHVASHLRDRGVETRAYYKTPIHLQPAFRTNEPLSLPIAEELSRSLLALPMFPEITEDEQAYVADAINGAMSAR